MLDAKQLAKNIQAALADITAFIEKPEFQTVLAELAAVPPELREYFIRSVLISREELSRRGVEVPEDITVQRSAFEDNRPTLFCITKYLPEMGNARKKVTVTFDEGWENAWELPSFPAEKVLGGRDVRELIGSAAAHAA